MKILKSSFPMQRNWFSNFIPYKSPLSANGIKYATPEHFYQASKADLWNDHLWVAQATTPGGAKGRGRRIKVREDWDEIKLSVMEQAIRHRLLLEPEWTEKLLSEKLPIVEVNTWHDNFWGQCTCNKCKNISGLNNLGKLLMRLREELIENNKNVKSNNLSI